MLVAPASHPDFNSKGVVEKKGVLAAPFFFAARISFASEVRVRAAHLRREPPMNVILEVLNALASMATIAEFLLDRWREYRHQRMTEGEKEKTGGNRSF